MTTSADLQALVEKLRRDENSDPDRILPNLDVSTIRGMMLVADQVLTRNPHVHRLPIEQLLKSLALTITDLKALIERCLEGDQDAIRMAQRIIQP
jgi:hypothetical protein